MYSCYKKLIRNCTFVMVIALWPVAVLSQNLIPNPGFENNYGMPWSNVDNMGTSDYYDKLDTAGAGMPYNYFGFQRPRSGNAHIGLYVQSNSSPDYREYAISPLSDTLYSGETYYAEMYVNLANNNAGCACDAIGMYFTNRPMGYPPFLISAMPQVSAGTGYLSDTLHWMKVSGTFEAAGGEKFIIIGNFKNDKNTRCSGDIAQSLQPSEKTKNRKNRKNSATATNNRVHNSCSAYYYVDDISVYRLPIPDSTISSDLSDAPRVFPLNKVFTLKSVRFPFNEYELPLDSYQELNDMVGVLNRDPEINVKIMGHTDDQGTPAFNKSLSIERANAVANYLISRSIDKNRVMCEGYGSTMPIVDNGTESGRHANRRVEVILLKNIEPKLFHR